MRTYTTKELLAILRLAKRKFLWNGKGPEWPRDQFVCLAAGRATKELEGHWETPRQIEELVERHIGDHGTMESFLKEKFGDVIEHTAQPVIQKWRRIMIDSMIKMLETEEVK